MAVQPVGPKRNSVYDTAGRSTRIGNIVAKQPRPHKPAYWAAGQNPYANNGMPNQTFLRNPSTDPSNA